MSDKNHEWTNTITSTVVEGATCKHCGAYAPLGKDPTGVCSARFTYDEWTEHLNEYRARMFAKVCQMEVEPLDGESIREWART